MRTSSGHRSKSHQNVENDVWKISYCLIMELLIPKFGFRTSNKAFVQPLSRNVPFIFRLLIIIIDVNVAISLSIDIIIIVRRLGNAAFANDEHTLRDWEMAARGWNRWRGGEKKFCELKEEKAKSKPCVCWFFPVSTHRVMLPKYKLKNGSARGMALFTETFRVYERLGRKTEREDETKWYTDRYSSGLE